MMSNTKIIKPGKNCLSYEPATRIKFLIDAASYYRTFYEAVSRAERSVLIVGWDIHSRLELLRDDERHKFPVVLGDFLNAVVEERPDLQIHILNWDFSVLYIMERESFPTYRLEWKSHERIHFRMDGQLPFGASHHQKIVVVDDKVAFTGGLDLAIHRWDTSAHRPEDERRKDPKGEHFTPYHDVQMMVEGPAAKALGDLIRSRWKRSAGKKIPEPETDPEITPWPENMSPDIQNHHVAISRSYAEWRDYPAVHEVKRLHLDALAAAEKLVYIENQYLTSASISDALAESLSRKEGPQIIMVLPKQSSGWMEQSTMDVLRSRLLTKLRNSDAFSRLHVYYPAVLNDQEIKVHVHAKVMIVDDIFVKVGSSNLSNRSMGLDSECDLAMEFPNLNNQEKNGSAPVAEFRNKLMAHHLGMSVAEFKEAADKEESLIEVIRNNKNKHKLLPLDGKVEKWRDDLVPVSAVIDSENPIQPDQLLKRFFNDFSADISRKKPILRIIIMASFLIFLSAVWRWTPLYELITIDRLSEWADSVQGNNVNLLIALAVLTVGSILMLPFTMLAVGVTLIFGPVSGFLCAMLGSFLSCSATFFIGRYILSKDIEHLLGKSYQKLKPHLQNKGIWAVMLFRNVPIAPFTVFNLAAGSLNIPYSAFILGSLIGLTPGIFVLSFYTDQVIQTLKNPNLTKISITVTVLIVLVIAGFFSRKFLRSKKMKD